MHSREQARGKEGGVEPPRSKVHCTFPFFGVNVFIAEGGESLDMRWAGICRIATERRKFVREHSKHLLFSALLFFVLEAIASPLRAAKSDWNNLNILNPGQQIRVVMKDAKTYQSEFKAVDEQGITLQRSSSEQALARKDVRRVFVRGKNHLPRNMVIGGAIGAVLFALPAVLAIQHNVSGNIHQISTTLPWIVFVPAGALVGAAMPTGQWREVYRAH